MIEFTDSDFESLVWKKLTKYFESLIAGYHKDLEKSHLNSDETASMRGRIKVLRLLIALDKRVPVNLVSGMTEFNPPL